MRFPHLLLNFRLGKFARDREQSSARLAFLVAEASIGITFATEDNG
jgi:hypothetical protein